MRAVILAAGRGSRMRALTEDRPKCLVELAGRSLLSRQLAALRQGGIGEIAIVRGYRGGQLAGFGLATFDNPRWAETNMVVSLACAEAWLSEAPCLVSYSDIFYSAETVALLAAAAGDIVISYDRDWLAQWRRRFADPLSDAENFRLDSKGRVLAIGGRAKSVDDIEGQYMGLLKFTPTGWRQVRCIIDPLPAAARDRLDMTGMLARLIAAGIPVAAVPASGGWGEIDSESDLALFTEMLSGAPA
jgi:choline kinase